MRATSTGLAAIVLATCVSAACSKSGPAAPSATPAAAASGSSEVAPLGGSWGPEAPPFNLEAVLRPVGEAGFGLVKFRQPNGDPLGPEVPLFAIPDCGHHVMIDQPLALVAALRALLSVWPS